MDVGLVVLGVIVLFGAGALFKSTGVLGQLQSMPSTEAPYPERRGKRRENTLPEAPPAARMDFRVCRNCFSENIIDAEYCSYCGKRLIRPKDLKVSEEQRKWFRQFNWTNNPFTPDVLPSLFTGYKGQVDEVLKKLSLHSGDILVLGDLGTGKTTLLRWLELNLPDNLHPIYVFRPPDRFSELIDVVAYSLESAYASKAAKHGEYNIYNIDKLVQRTGKHVVILLDEVHEMDSNLNKPLTTLSDIENIDLVLAGVPSLEGKVKKENPALYDRIISRIELPNLSAEETEELVSKRIEHVGGWGHEPFTDDAVDEIYEVSGGNPRAIIKLCNSAVSEAITQGVLSIDKAIVAGLGGNKNVVGFDVPRAKPGAIAPVSREEKAADLKGVVRERISKIDKLYQGYVKAGDEKGVKEVLGIAKSTIEESKKRLEDASLAEQERERFTLMVELFEDWIKKLKAGGGGQEASSSDKPGP